MNNVNFPSGSVDLMIRLQKLPASSASAEKVFSNFSYVQILGTALELKRQENWYFATEC